jgi:hypothetical protein
MPTAHPGPKHCYNRVLMNDTIRAAKKGNRPECGCHTSRDIGDYDTCPHGCVYCYAVQDKTLAQRQYREHDPAGGFLIAPEGQWLDASDSATQLPCCEAYINAAARSLSYRRSCVAAETRSGARLLARSRCSRAGMRTSVPFGVTRKSGLVTGKRTQIGAGLSSDCEPSGLRWRQAHYLADSISRLVGGFFSEQN